jgi:hypothetical protein
MHTLLEKPSVTQDHNTRVTENYVTHIDREAQSLVLTDFSDRSTWMMEFSVTLVFWSCVTLGFFNSVYDTFQLISEFHMPFLSEHFFV